MDRAIIYARVSTDEQAQAHSLPSQVEACRNYCASKGYGKLAVCFYFALAVYVFQLLGSHPGTKVSHSGLFLAHKSILEP